jgi:PAS domain S-box-containing protein
MGVRDPDEKFATAFRCSPQPFTLSTIKEDRYIDVNDAFVQKTGWTREEAIGRTTVELGIWETHAEREKLVKRMLGGEKISNLECRFRNKSGGIFTALLSAEPINIEGEPCVVANAIDISEWKRTQEALADMGRKLIGAHEEERTFIARELHDDIGQRVALLAIGLAQLRGSLTEEGLASYTQICQRLSEIGRDIQELSHRLHSSKLEYLGITAAVRSFCRELSDQQNVEIGFSHEGVPSGLPKEISLCLFRVLQEALQNAVKHSGARHFKVELLATSEDIRLSVHDSGRGFDQASEVASRGLGLVSMRERVRMINGELTIESRPNSGTTVKVRAPLNFGEIPPRGAV